MTPNIAVMLSGSGTTFQNLLEREKDGRLLGHISLVVADNAKAYGLQRAEIVGIENMVLSPRVLGDDYAATFFRLLTDRNISLVVLAGYLKIVPMNAKWLGKIVNIHPALLPKFGGKGMYGLHVHEAVIRSGEAVSGCTVHFVDNEYDHGPIIAQSTVPVLLGDSPQTLQSRVQEAERVLYPKVISEIISGHIQLMQDGSIRRS
jgi:phosphoribosylglycinamide formyltransferase-1